MERKWYQVVKGVLLLQGIQTWTGCVLLLTNSYAGWNFQRIGPLFCSLEFQRDRMWAGVSAGNCQGLGGRVGYVSRPGLGFKASIALYQMTLCQSPICLWTCLGSLPSSTICPQLFFHLTTNPPFIPPPPSTPFTTQNPPIVKLG